MREIFPVSDLWQNGSVCKCGERMKVLAMGHYADEESAATLECAVCKRVVSVTQRVRELSPGRSSLETAI